MTKNNDLLPEPAQQPPFAVHTSHKEVSLTFGWTGDAHGVDINSASALCNCKVACPRGKSKGGVSILWGRNASFPTDKPSYC